jgi:hypothetical protein
MGRQSEFKQRLTRVLDLAERWLEGVVGSEPGASVFQRQLAFRWDSTGGRGQLVAITRPARFDLDDLIGVDESVAALERNIQQFMAGYPFNNVLLHGERGTGKSSAVKGLLERYGPDGLRLIEVERTDLAHLPHVLGAIRNGVAQHFIIFCDDLSFGPGESGYRELKAALEGSLEAPAENVCIVATSNRRNLVPETMAENRVARLDEAGELHLGEALEEKLALADRFGLVLGFYNFDQDTYLAIVERYLGQSHIGEMTPELRRRALQWALEKASRSGRAARQFVDDAVGRSRLSDG